MKTIKIVMEIEVNDELEGALTEKLQNDRAGSDEAFRSYIKELSDQLRTTRPDGWTPALIHELADLIAVRAGFQSSTNSLYRDFVEG